MLSYARDQVLTLACVRHGLPALHARGVDALPAEVTEPLRAALVGSLDPDALEGALRTVVDSLNHETHCADPDLGERLAAPLAELGRFEAAARQSDSGAI